MIDFSLLTSLFDFCPDRSPNHVIFDPIESPWSSLLNIFISLISHLNASPNLINILKIYQEISLIIYGFDPYSPLC